MWMAECASLFRPTTLPAEEGAYPAGRRRLQHAAGFQIGEFAGIDTEPAFEHLGGVAAERRRTPEPHGFAVDAHRPGRHLVRAVMVFDVLHDAARLKAGLVLQLHRVEYRARRHADCDQLLHRLALIVLLGP